MSDDYTDPEAWRRYLLGYRFGWRDLMNEAHRRAQQTGVRQRVLRDGLTWLVVPTHNEADR
jgi:hypothetical protein